MKTLFVTAMVIVGVVTSSVPRSDRGNCLSTNQFECVDGSCIDQTLVCDSFRDCRFGDDERPSFCANYTCIPGMVKCKDSYICIDEDVICDGRGDCPDGSDEDESLCSNFVCPEDSLACGDNRCIRKDNLCDAVASCPEYEDESTYFVTVGDIVDSEKMKTKLFVRITLVQMIW